MLLAVCGSMWNIMKNMSKKEGGCVVLVNLYQAVTWKKAFKYKLIEKNEK